MRYRNHKIILLATIGFLISVSSVSAKNFTIYNATNINQPYFSVNGTSGNVGIGLTNPSSPLQMLNNSWISARNAAGTGAVNMFKINANDQIEVGAPLNIGSFEFSPDSGLVTFVDMPVSATPTIGTPEGYVFKADGDNIMTIYSEANGFGGVQNKRIGIGLTNPIGLLHVAGTENIILNTTGNIGIGTTSPRNKLDFASSTINQINIAGGYIAGLDLTPTNSDQAVPLGYLQSNYSSTSSSLWSGTKNGSIWNGSAGAGNVGIGTTNPYTSLSIKAPVTNKNDFLLTLHGADNGGAWYGLGFGLTAHPASFIKAGITYQITNSTYGSGNLNFLIASSTNGTNATTTDAKMTITHQGNVGIGTTNPAYPVDITSANNTDLLQVKYGAAYMRLNPWDGSYGSRATIRSNSNNGFGLLVNSTNEAMTVNVSGNVGIGTTNPIDALHLATGVSPKLRISYNNAGYTAGAYRTLIYQDSIGLNIESTGAYSAGGDIKLSSFNSGNILLMSASNVGIGTTSPRNKLDFASSTINQINVAGGYIAGLDLTPTNSDQAVPLGYLQSNYAPIGSGAGSAFVQGGNSFGGIATLGTNDNNLLNIGTNSTTRMTIAANGNVGIGTTNPAYPVDITSANNTDLLQVKYGAAYMRLNPWDGSYGSRATIRSNSNNGFGLLVNSTNEAMTVNVSGNVGIGTTNPTQKLDIAGSLVFSATAYGPGSNNYWNSNTFNVAGGTGTIYARYLKDSGSNNNITLTGGNVGIATSNPQYLFDINKGADTARFHLGSGTYSPTGNLATQAFFFENAGGSNDYAIFQTKTSAGVGLNITNAGNVSVGTTTPVAKFVVAGGTGDVINVSGGQVAGLNSTPTNSDHAVPLGYLQNNYAPIGTGIGSAFVQGGNTFGTTATLGTNDNYPLNIETNSTTRMTITANGNVGIGTTSPVVKLDVAGGVAFRSSGEAGQASRGIEFTPTTWDAGVQTVRSWSAGGGLLLDSANTGTANAGSEIQLYASNSGSGDIVFRGTDYGTVQQDRMIIKGNNGNVGIGTTTPGAKLDVIGDISVASNKIRLGGTSASNAYSFIQHNGSNLITFFQSNWGADFKFSAADNLGTTRDLLFIEGNGGYVGINTTSPVVKLSVSAGTGDAIYAAGGQVGGLASVPLRDDHAVPLGYLRNNYIGVPPVGTTTGAVFVQGGNAFGTSAILGTNDNYPLNIETNNAVRMTVAANGNVGIGTTTAADKLVVNRGNVSNSSGGIIINNDTSNGYGGSLSINGNVAGVNYTLGRISAENISSGGYLSFSTASNGYGLNERMRIDNSGNIGIGTSSPMYPLHVKRTTTGTSGYFANNSNNLGGGAPLVVDDGNFKFGIGWDTTGLLNSYIKQDNFGVHFGATANKNIIFETGGNVSIGTSTPQAKLDIVSTGSNNFRLTYDSSNYVKMYSSSSGYFHVEPTARIMYLVSPGGTNSLYVGGDGVNHNRTQYSGNGISIQDTSYVAKTWITGVGNSYLNGGNLGIGSTTPNHKLSVAAVDGNGIGVAGASGNAVNIGGGQIANLNLTQLNPDHAVSLYYATTTFFMHAGNSFGATATLGTNDNNNLNIETNNLVRMTVANNGNIGIGVTNPQAKLEIASTTNIEGLRIISSNYSPFVIRNSANTADIFRIDQYGNITGGIGNSTAWTRSTTTNQLYVTDLNDKVGIGTTLPQQKMHIVSSAVNTNQPSSITNSVNDTHTGLFINNGLNLINSKYGIQFGGYNQYSFGGLFGVMTSSAGATIGDLTFDLKNAAADATLTERMRITSSGRVGIGTSNPGALLQVGENIATSGPIIMLGSQSGNYDSLGTISSNEFAIQPFSYFHILKGYAYTTGGRKFNTGDYMMTINNQDINFSPTGNTYFSTGNVGIGTTTPASKLQLNGNMRLVGTLNFRSSFNYDVLNISGDNSYVGHITHNTPLGASYGANGMIQLDSLPNSLGADGSTHQKFVRVVPGITQIAAAGFTAFEVDTSETSVGTGAKFLMNIKRSGNSKLVVDGAGNVGIGITNPRTKLDFASSTSNQIHAAGGYIGGLDLTPFNPDHAVPLGYLQSNYSSTSSSLWTGTKNGSIWNGDSGVGNVGIGITNPVSKLHVNGGVSMKRTAVANTDYTVQADDYIIGYTSIDANRTVTLPNALCTPGRFFVILDESGAASATAKIVIAPEEPTNIIGQDSLSLEDGYNSVYVFCGDNAWYIL